MRQGRTMGFCCVPRGGSPDIRRRGRRLDLEASGRRVISAEILTSELQEYWGQIGDEQAVEPLPEMLESPDEDARIDAANALADIGDVRAVEALRRALHDTSELVSEAARN